MATTQEFLITGPHTGEEPLLLCTYEPNIYHALMRAFATRNNRQLAESDPDLPPIMVKTQPGSDLVVGRFIEPRDTIYYKYPGIDGGDTMGVLDEGAWVQGTSLYSRAAGSGLTGWSNHTLILESLDVHGNPSETNQTVGVGVDEAALAGLYITRRNHIPLADATGMQARLFDPVCYLNTDV